MPTLILVFRLIQYGFPVVAFYAILAVSETGLSLPEIVLASSFAGLLTAWVVETLTLAIQHQQAAHSVSHSDAYEEVKNK